MYLAFALQQQDLRLGLLSALLRRRVLSRQTLLQFLALLVRTVCFHINRNLDTMHD